MGRKIWLADQLARETRNQEERRLRHGQQVSRARNLMRSLMSDGEMTDDMKKDAFIIMNEYDAHISQTAATLNAIDAFQAATIEDGDLTTEEFKELSDRKKYYARVLDNAYFERATIAKSFDDKNVANGGFRVIQEEFARNPSRQDWTAIISDYSPRTTEAVPPAEPGPRRQIVQPEPQPETRQPVPQRHPRPVPPRNRSTSPTSQAPAETYREPEVREHESRQQAPRQPRPRSSIAPETRNNRQGQRDGGRSGGTGRRGPVQALNDRGSFRVTTRKHVGPFVVHFSTRGVSSVALKMGFMTYRLWSKNGNSQRGLSSVDLPGPLSYRPSQARNRR